MPYSSRLRTNQQLALQRKSARERATTRFGARAISGRPFSTVLGATYRISVRLKILLTSLLCLIATLMPTLIPTLAHAHNLNLGSLTLNTTSQSPDTISLVYQMSDDQSRHLQSRVGVPSGCTSIYHAVELYSITRMRYRQDLHCPEHRLEDLSFTFEKLPPGARLMIYVQQNGVTQSEEMLALNTTTWQSGQSAESDSVSAVMRDYVSLGFIHILLGWDHLLFVWMLVLLAPNLRHLLWIITAFTLGHSLTLGLAAFSLIKIPILPTEAFIALSIVFMAAEVLRYHKNGIDTLTLKYPGLISIGFGLFHGLGFSSVLQDLRTDNGPILWQLAGFNIGVELGQIVFVAVLLITGHICKTRLIFAKKWFVGHQKLFNFTAAQAISIGCGSLAAFWFIERAASF